jgi:hypothetical protein
VSDPAPDAETYMALVEALTEADPRLSPLAAGILAAAHLDIAHDSRSFAKALGISHALVLREVEILSGDLGLLTVIRREARTQRCFYAVAEGVVELVSRL